MKRKLLLPALALAACLGLTACGHTHTWQDATCTAPKTCAECGETEGEPLAHSWTDATCAAPKTCPVCGTTEGGTLEHSWTDATCAAPKTCSVCGTTEGEALAHTLSEATYQSPAVCSACGEAVGDPLTSSFESGALDKSAFHPAALGVTFDYHGLAYDDRSVEQTNHMTFEDFRVIASDGSHDARDGYEWQIVQVRVVADDPTVPAVGWSAFMSCYDRYSGVEFDTDAGCTISYNGADYACQSRFDVFENDNSGCRVEFAIQVPAGYDGVIVIAEERFSGDEFEQEHPHLSQLSGMSVHYVCLGA